jgi:hypothetical protein
VLYQGSRESVAVGKTRWYWPSALWRIASITRCCGEALEVMSKSVLAKVHWIPAEEGGRAFLPTGKKYATVSRFTEDADTWLQEAWSVVLEFDEPPSVQGNPSIASPFNMCPDQATLSSR